MRVRKIGIPPYILGLNVPVKLAASAIRNVVHDSKKNKAVSRRGKSEILVSFVTCNWFRVKDYNILLTNSCYEE